HAPTAVAGTPLAEQIFERRPQIGRDRPDRKLHAAFSLISRSLISRRTVRRPWTWAALDLGGASVGTRRGLSQVGPGDFVSAKGREHLGLSSCTNVHSTTRCTQLAWLR